METGITLAAIAKEIKMDPKNARARMRRVTVPKGYTIGDSWTFKKAHKAWVVAALKRDGRKTA